MARIAGVELPNQKRVEIGLTYIYGIGRTTSNQILAKTGIDPDVRCKDLTEDDVSKLRDEIENSHKVEDPSATRVNQENRIKLMLAVAREKLDTPIAPIRPLTAEELAGGAPQVATTVQ